LSDIWDDAAHVLRNASPRCLVAESISGDVVKIMLLSHSATLVSCTYPNVTHNPIKDEKAETPSAICTLQSITRIH